MNKLYKNVKLSKDVFVGEFSVLGKPSRPHFNSLRQQKFENLSTEESLLETIISPGCYIDAHVIIEEGVFIGPNCMIESGCLIQKGAIIGGNTLVVHGARILQDSNISGDSVIGGFIADRSIIKENCRILGKLLHRQDDPYFAWDDYEELAPVIEKNVFVGVDAKLIGGIHIGDHSYICSNSFVTRNIPPQCVVKGVNEIVPIASWPGKLRSSLFWRRDNE